MNTGVGSLSPVGSTGQGSPGDQLRNQTWVFCIASGFFTAGCLRTAPGDRLPGI